MRIKNYINGEFLDSVSKVNLDNYNPSIGKVYGSIPDSDERDVNMAIQAAKTALNDWKVLSFEARFDYLLKIAHRIEERMSEFVEAESLDNGKPRWLAAKTDVPRAISNLKFFASAQMNFPSESHHTPGQGLNYTLRQPIGVVGCISPWNLPLYLFTWKMDQDKVEGANFFSFIFTKHTFEIHNWLGSLGAMVSHRFIYNGFGIIRSVDVVYTNDKSLWSRCPVLETQDISTLAEGGANKLELRKSQSIDKNGNFATVGSGTSNNPNDANYIGENGMGWFPGYVIDLETGERLNVAYGEDSRLANDNGRDMLFNPTSTLSEGIGSFVGGGKHYLYIFRNNKLVTSPGVMIGSTMPYYDNGSKLYNDLNSTNTLTKRRVWLSCMWVGTPITAQGQDFLSTDAILKVRVATTYERYATKGHISPANTSDSENDWYNLYRFDTRSVATGKNNLVSAKSALDLINVVPNPYYAYSNYEQSRLENKIKITNLPDKCTVKIYNITGSLVRTFTKDDPVTSLDWDLNNVNGVPIAGGVYIIHVNVPDVGEKIIKWFGALRPPDLTNF